MPNRRARLWRGLVLSTSTSVVALLAAGALNCASASTAAQLLSPGSLAAAGKSLSSGGAGVSPAMSAAAQAQIALSAANLARAAQALKSMAAQQAAASAVNVLLNPSGQPLSGLQCSPQCDPISQGSTIATDATQWVNLQPIPTKPVTDPTVSGRYLPTQTMTVVQTSQNAIATWSSFNLYTGETLFFNQQGNSNWTVLNRVSPSVAPSQIFGTIEAPGAVYVINRNGIIFGGSAQINVHSLIASSLDVGQYPTQSVADRNSFFLDSGILDQNAATDGAVSFSYNASDTAVEGDVVVQPGAVINAIPAPAAQATDSGGFVYLFAPNVRNGGTINAPAGEALLVAAEQISLVPNAYPEAGITSGFNAVGVQFNDDGYVAPPGVPASPAPVRWNVNGFVTTPGEVTNTGLIESDRGTVILNGDYVWQGGVIQADTSVSRNGSIFLDSTIQTTLTAASSTQILPDEDGGTIPIAAIGSFVPGQVEMSGNTVDIEGLVEAPGAAVAVKGLQTATEVGSSQNIPVYPPAIDFVTLDPTQAIQNPITADGLSDPNAPVELRSSPRIFLGSGAVIDVSGLDGVTRSVADNFITVKPNGNEFADQPLQRDGALLNQPLTFDIRQSGTLNGTSWVGSPLMDVSSYAGSNFLDNIDELLTAGGTVKLSANVQGAGGVIQQQGSLINVSGGYVQYTGAFVSSTNLLDADGQIVNIAAANPLDTYVGIAGVVTEAHPHWGVTETFVVPLLAGGTQFQPGYVEGRDAGGVSVTASDYVNDGTIVGDVIAGQRQAALGQISTYLDTANSADLRFVQLGIPPGSSTLQFDPYAMPSAGYFAFSVPNAAENLLVESAVPSQTDPASFTVDTPLSGAVTTDIPTAPLAFSATALSGLGQVSLTTGASAAGTIQIAAGANLAMQPGGIISLTSSSIAIDGTLTAHAGSITAEAIDAVAGNDGIVIGAQAVLDASGLWVNDAGASPGAVIGGAYINGGAIRLLTDNRTSGSISSPVFDITGNIVLDSVTAADGSTQHALFDVASGGRVTPSGGFQLGSNGLPAGNGGSLTLQTYADQSYSPSQTAAVVEPTVAAPVATIEISSTDFSHLNASGNPTVSLAATLPADFVSAYGVAKGGSFTAQAAGVQLGGTAPSSLQNGTFYLPTSFFTGGGFSNYNLTAWASGLAVEADTPQGSTFTLQQQNFLLSSALATLPTGADLAQAATVGLLPEIVRTPANLQLAAYAEPYPYPIVTPPQADVASAYPSLTAQPDLLIDNGVQIVADPKASIGITIGGRPSTLGSGTDFLEFSGQTGLALILGTISAPGGSITIADASNVASFSPSAQVWLGPNSRLDVSGTAITDTRETLFRAGQVLAGGTVTVDMTNPGSSFVGEPGAVIDVSGAAGIFDILQPGSGGLAGSVPRVPTTVWSDAGTISLTAPNLFYAGSYAAQPGASEGNGGTLVLQTGSAINVQQSGPILPAGLQPLGSLGTAGQSVFDASQLTGSGIANLTLSPSTAPNIAADANGDSVTNLTYEPGAITFTGTVSLSVPGNLLLDAQTITLTPSTSTGQTGPSTVALSANYVALRGGYLTSTTNAASSGSNTLGINAQTIDLAGGVLDNVAQANFTAAGDIRLRVPYAIAAKVSSGIFAAELLTAGNLTLTAAQVYPVSDTDFTLKSLGANSTIAINGNGNATLAPLSAGGAVTLSAANIVQDGTLLAPLGTIRLGTQTVSDLSPNDVTPSLIVASGTNQVTLDPNSITSTSLNGLTIPYGETTDGQNWTYAAHSSSTTSFNTAPLTAPPAQDITVSGRNIAVSTGAVVNLSGGGDISASEFVPGTGGSKDVLSSANFANVYAVIPGYNPAVAPVNYDFTFADGDAVSAVGSSVFLSGGGGLAAGYYTLLPAHYATLPGAYRVALVANSSDALSTNNRILQDGTVDMAGYFANPALGTRAALTSLFSVQSAATWRQYSEIDQTSGSSYFASLAATNGTVTPPLPIDAGHLVLNAVSSLNLAGQFQLAPAAGGLGSQVDIAAQNIQILAPNGSVTASTPGTTYLGIDATQLTDIGADSLLIGGVRQDNGSGVTITPTAENIEVSNDAASPLAAPELILVAGSVITTTTTTTVSTTVATTNGTTTTKGPTTGTTSSGGSFGGSIRLDSGSVIEARGTPASRDPTSATLGVLPAISPTTTSSTGTVTVTSGHTTKTTTTTTTSTTTGSGGDSAFLSVSNGPPLTAQQTAATSAATLTISSGATITGNAVTLDAQGAISVASGATITARNILASSQSVNLGGGSGGFMITSGVLAQLEQAESLTLQASSAINFFGNVDLAMADPVNSELVLDSDALVAVTAGTATISAGTVDLQNSSAASTATNSGSFGTLQVNAGTIELGNGAETLGNFGAAGFTAAQEIVTGGSGSLTMSAGNLTFTTPLFLVGAGSNETIADASGSVLFTNQGVGFGTPTNAAEIGGTLSVTAASIEDNTLLQAMAGGITLEATTGDVTLDANAVIDATGFAQTFFDQIRIAGGGIVQLTADSGDLVAEVGARIDVSSPAGLPGYAGQVVLTAANGNLDFNPTGGLAFDPSIFANPVAGDGGGSLMINVNTLAASVFSAISVPSLFNNTVDIHTALGSLSVATSLIAQNVTLTADTGTVGVSGTINASGQAPGDNGGTIALYGSTVALSNGANLLATAFDYTDPNSTLDGGTIILGTSGTPTTVGGAVQLNNDGSEQFTQTNGGSINVSAGATLNVSGGGKGVGGTVHLRAPLTTANTVNITFGGDNSIVGASNVTIEGYKIWSAGDPNSGFNGTIDPLNNPGFYGVNGPLVSFVQGFSPANESSFTAINSGGSVTFQPGIELDNPNGNITVASTWNLGAGVAGFLTNTVAFTLKKGTVTVGTVITNADGNLLPVYANYTGYLASAETFTISSGTVSAGTVITDASGNLLSLFSNYSSYRENATSFTVKKNTVVPIGTVITGANGQLLPIYSNYTGALEPVAGLPGYFTNATSFKVAATGTVAAGTVITNASGALASVYTYTGYYENAVSFTANGGTVAIGTVITNAQGTLDSLYSGYDTGYFENAASFTTSGGTIAVGTAITDAEGNLLPEYASVYDKAADTLAFATGTSQITELYYRTNGGSPTGVAPDITLRASGNLDINASISDGFFETTDTLNTRYVNAVNAWVKNNINPSAGAQTAADLAAYEAIGDYVLAGALPNGGAGGALPIAPYNASANVISPIGNNNSAPIAEANLFPLMADGTAIQSSSYNLVGGANVASADPLALQPLSVLAATGPSGTGDVTISGHTTALVPGSTTISMNIPTIVRTGTGSINIAAGLDFVLGDTTAPGVVYTAGRNAAPLPSPDYTLNNSLGIAVASQAGAAGFLTPQIVQCQVTKAACNDGPITAAAYPVDGGDLTVVAQRNIDGYQQSATNQQFFAPWLVSQGTNLSVAPFGPFAPESAQFANLGVTNKITTTPAQTSWWINFGSFDQGLMSVGGNVRISAGGDISQLSVSLPTTAAVSGGLSYIDATGNVIETPAVFNLNPSGNLTVTAGGNILSGTYYEGSGKATITAGGSVVANLTSSQNTGSVSISTLLAVDTGSIALRARGSIDLAGIVSGAAQQDVNDATKSGIQAAYISSYGPESKVTLEAISGNVVTNSLDDATVTTAGSVLSSNVTSANGTVQNSGVSLYPASFEADSFLGNVNVDGSLNLTPSSDGALALLAQGSLRAINPAKAGGGGVISTGPSLVDNAFDPLLPAAGFGPAPGSPGYGTVFDLGPLLLPQDNGTPDLFYAVTGDIVSGAADGKGLPLLSGGTTAINYTLQWEIDKPSVVHAGRDIVDLPFFGQNLAPTDVTAITAGRDIVYTDYSEANLATQYVQDGISTSKIPAQNPAGLSLAGPGFFDIQAGGNIGPFVTPAADLYASNKPQNDATGDGIITFGNLVAVGNRLMTAAYGNSGNTTGTATYVKPNAFATIPNDPLLPSQGADIVVNFGTGKGIDYTNVINTYINPAPPAGVTPAATNYLPQLEVFLQLLGQAAPASTSVAWTDFQALPADLQDVFVDQVVFSELKAGGINGQKTGDYSLGYNAVNALFPASLGYSASDTSSGDLDMLHAVVKTEQSAIVAGVATGGDIDLLGPDGSINVGSTAAELNTKLANSALGILTLDNGTINTFTNGSVNVDQSRVLTTLGGDILMWSSNGDLDAGRGKKTTIDFTPLSAVFGANAFQTVNGNGLVSGAGIGTIQALPTAPPADTFLFAPHGTIDFGAAGVRSTRNLIVAARFFRNAANASVAGTTTGTPTPVSVNLGALEGAGSTAGAASQAASAAANQARQRNGGAPQAVPAVITVRVLGYGNCDTSKADCGASP